MVWTLMGIFVGGLALNLTPCIYPMIPITVSFFGGRSGGQTPSQSQLTLHGLCYLSGLALTNSILGVAAALTGGLMGSMLQNPIVLFGIAGILVFFAASLFGLWEIRLPGALTQMAAKTYSGYIGSLFMGITLGIVAAPCIGPFVLGLLTWIAGIGNAWIGFLVFFVLSLGLGMPLFILALFSGQLQRLPRAGGWMLWVRRLMGWVLIGMAAYFIRPLLPSPVKIFLISGISFAGAIDLGWLDKNKADLRVFAWLKTIVGVAGVVSSTFWITAWALQGPGISWQSYSEFLLTQSKNQNKPVIIDFYADWCSPCRELEEITFHHPAVVRLAENNFTMIKVDLTRGGNPLHERLLEKYDVKGVPTLVLIDKEGKEKKNMRLVDFHPPELFLELMIQLNEDAE